MKIFSFSFGSNDDDDPDDEVGKMGEMEVPPEVEAAMENLAETLTDFIMQRDESGIGLRHNLGSDDEEVKAVIQADHDRYDALEAHLKGIKGTSEGATDGNKLRVVAFGTLQSAIADNECVHDNAMATDLLGMADRLDELDLKESEIGA